MGKNAELLKSPAIATPPGYSHGARVSEGQLIFLAGQVGLKDNGDLAGSGFAEQAAQAFENVTLALKACGATFSDVIKLNYYIVDISNLPLLREIRDRYVDSSHPPVSTAVGVAGLFRPEFLVEIEAVAVVDR